MNQTRTMLWMAWLMVAAFLMFQWGDFIAQKNAPAAATKNTALPTASAANGGSNSVPTPSTQTAATPVASAVSKPSSKIRVRTDVLDVLIDSEGGSIVRAELLTYPLEKNQNKGNVVLFDTAPGLFYVAQSGWINASKNAPSHLAQYQYEKTSYELAAGADSIEVPLQWTGANGVTLRKVFVFKRGHFDVAVKETVKNAGQQSWTGEAYQQLVREAPPAAPKHSTFTNPESFSFIGSAWYSEESKFDKRKFDEYLEDGELNLTASGGWMAMLQHHFTSAWIPQKDVKTTFSLVEENNAQKRYVIRGLAGLREVAPNTELTQTNTLWVGPKLQSKMNTVHPTLRLSLDYGIFSFIAQPLFWILSKLHDLFGNWGWAIIGIVVLLKLALFWFSKKQYESSAKMRALQPRLEALKERYGDDQQKFAMAQWELFQKEKVNPMSGCLPILIPIPIFFALYWVLLESVELRQAPWLGWIQNLTAPDPYFILPVLNLGVMWATQKLTPMPGMDPMQKKIMQWMPIVFGVLMLFFPSGLVLYWVTNGGLGLLQQWWMTKKFAPQAAPATK
jgi:YidC/Oxa1 family membrane protein insertase